MKRFTLTKRLCCVMLLCIGTFATWAQADNLVIRFADASGAPIRRASATLPEKFRLEGTGAEASATIVPTGLAEDISVSVTSGFSVTPEIIKADAGETQITVKNLSTRATTTGKLILRSGDIRTYVEIEAHGTPLPVKDLSKPGGKDYSFTALSGDIPESQEFDADALSDNGFTLELRAKTDDGTSVLPYAVTSGGLGFKSYIRSSSIGMMNSKNVFVSEKGISNPANGGTFYNTDGQYHTYRYAVTPDRRVFIYRDGMPVDTFRVADLALQPEWSETNGEVERNLIKNGDFEGEWDFSESQNITKYIEGWDVYPYDQYNSYQDITREERSNEVDQNNHVLDIHRYMWNDGWAAAEISQIVDVAPNETYAFSALAKGGQYSGSPLGSIRIQDLQNDGNKATLTVTSDSYQTYATDFETKANTKQIRIYFYLERAKWGASVSGFKVDDVKLTGVRRIATPTVGFDNQSAELEYFSFDPTGAYAPAFASLTTSADEVTINGTGNTQTFTVSAENLTGDISVSVSSGFEVSPTTLPASAKDAVVTVKNLSTLNTTTGRVILRSADMRKRINLTAYGTPLPVKDLSQAANAAAQGYSFKALDGSAAESQQFDASTLTDQGYTVEVRAKTDESFKTVLPYAVTTSGLGFEGYVRGNSVGLMNSKNVFISEKGISNPANGGTFYNTDGQYHTYRYAVTADRRVFVYRDGMPVDTFRVADLALQPEWSETNGDIERNLIKNGDFEGESNYSSRAGTTTRIEGWDIYPIDQYNTAQSVTTEERSNEVDQNNHVLSTNRYYWEGGWADGEISQIVDVAPNETYAFSALAKGGIRKNGEQLATIRIQDLQNDDNKVSLKVTSENYQTYATDFTTKANTKQIRVWFNLARAAWGDGGSSLKVDDVKLTGVRRIPTQQIGFQNNNAELEYFAFDPTGAYAPAFASLSTSADELTIDGTNASRTFTVSAENLTGDISVTATHGFAVTPTVIKAGTKTATVRVTHLTTLLNATGKVILRSGDMRAYVNLTGHGTALPVKDISQAANASAQGYTFTALDGSAVESQEYDASALTDQGYTVEIKARTDEGFETILPYAVTASGLGFEGYVRGNSVGMMNSKNVFVSEKGISNPANGGTFYNDDGLFHTYRYAVTPDRRVFVYRDGLPIDTFRVADLALQPEWSEKDGPISKNLIKNGDFEGEWDFSKSQNITKYIEGWDVYPYDQYNSYQNISSEERSNEVDQNNHVLSMHRYMWEGGWADGEISQIVDVAPNDIYTFSALAKGGIRSNGDILGSIRIQDLQNDDNKVNLKVTSESYQTYAVDFETKANTKQIRITFGLGRAAWGASVSAFKIDNVRLIGTSRVPTPQIGFQNNNADIEYFSFDPTGAYAPALPGLTVNDINDAIRSAKASSDKLHGRIVNGQLELTGVKEHARVVVYNINGTQVATLNDYSTGTGIGLPRRATYIVAVFEDGERRVIKVM